MDGSMNSPCLGPGCEGRNILNLSESRELRRLLRLVERMFQVPVAYVAMLGRRDRVMTRIGSGEEYWQNLKTYPLDMVLAAPLVVRDTADGLPDGVDLGELRFVAAAPLRTLCGQPLGVVVMADLVPRPDFSALDLAALAEMAGVLTTAVEARMAATRARELRLELRECEERFRLVANASSLLIGCMAADGACRFVNRTWLEFTGRNPRAEQGDGWYDTIHPEHREALVNGYWRAWQERVAFTLDAPLRRHDGVFRWMRCEGTPRPLEAHVSAGFLVCLTDLAGYHGEASRFAREAECLAALARVTGAQYAIFDEAGRIEQASPGFGQAAGAAAENLRGQRAASICPRLEPSVAKVLSNQTPACVEIDSSRWMVTPIRVDPGKPVSALAVLLEPDSYAEEPSAAIWRD